MEEPDVARVAGLLADPARARMLRALLDGFAMDLSGRRYNTIAEVKDYADFVRQQLLAVPSVAKDELYGVQDEKIYIEFSHARLAMLGVPVDQILDVVRKQNAIAASGTITLTVFQSRAGPPAGERSWSGRGARRPRARPRRRAAAPCPLFY